MPPSTPALPTSDWNPKLDSHLRRQDGHPRRPPMLRIGGMLVVFRAAARYLGTGLVPIQELRWRQDVPHAGSERFTVCMMQVGTPALQCGISCWQW